MSLLEQASLVITPNAYKESKLYSVVPNTTLGDMDVVRATTATRVNSAGLIEVVPRNLAQYSEAFDNGYWGKFNATITANNTTSPTGTSTADKIVENTVNSFHSMDSTFSSGTGIYTASIYAKVGERRYLRLNITEITPAIDHTALFDLQTGTLLSSGTGVTASIINAGNGWYRIILTSPALVGGQVRMAVLMQTTTSSTPQQYLGDGTSGLYLWGAQLEQGSTATEYFPTTTRLNIPRIDYTNGSCPSLLVEPQRTNLILRSEELDNAIWTKSGVTITANAFNSPSGILTADLVTPTVSDASLRQSFLSAGAIQYNFSIYLRSATGNSFSTTLRCWRDSPFTNITNSVITVTTEWQRFNFSFTALDSSTHTIAIGASSTLSTGENFYAWGAQLELGSYPTSYIPTIASTVNRNADVISKTNINNFVGNNQGTFLYDIKSYTQQAGIGQPYWAYLENGSKNICFYDTGIFTSINGGFVSLGALPNGTMPFKVAYRWNASFISVFINGVKTNEIAKTATFNPTIFTPTYFSVNSKQVYNKIIGFNTSLTDQECINLTTL